MDHSWPQCCVEKKNLLPFRKFTPDPWVIKPLDLAVKTVVSRVIRDYDLPGTYSILGHYRKRQEIVMIYVVYSKNGQ